MIEINNLSFAYRRGAPPQLQVQKLMIHAGEVTAVMGKSGGGKSTLLSCIAGLLVPQSGQVRVLGNSLERMNDSQRAKFRRTTCDFIFQDFALVESLTAGENIRLAARLAGKKVTNDEIAGAMARVGLVDMSHRRVWELSGGQQQRVAVARALVKNGRVILADEPTSALDEASTEMVLDSLREFAHRDGKPVLVVTHDRDVASIADRVITVDGGHIISDTADIDLTGATAPSFVLAYKGGVTV